VWRSPRVNVRISWVLLRQVDNLARHHRTSRSDIVRRAILRYVRDKDNALFANPNSVMIAKAYEYIKEDYPYVQPYESDFILFLAERKAHKEDDDDEEYEL
jgi:hypothetical protein